MSEQPREWIIPVKGGLKTLVDEEDFERLNKFKWHYTKNPGGKIYVVRVSRVWEDCYPVRVTMHRDILGAKKGQICDHINSNTLDNRRSNLRICTTMQNAWNRFGSKNKTSKYKGVSWKSDDKRWQVAGRANNKHYYLGVYKSEEEGAIAYNKFIKKHHGVFAKFNVVEKV